MAEELTFISGSKEEQYLSLLPQVRSLIEGEVDLVANLANVAAALKEAFDFFWVGFYLVKQCCICTRISWYWARSKVRWLARVSGKAKEFAVLPGRRVPRCWCRMWKFFRDILLAVRYPDRK